MVLYRLCIQYSPIKIELFSYYVGIIQIHLDYYKNVFGIICHIDAKNIEKF